MTNISATVRPRSSQSFIHYLFLGLLFVYLIFQSWQPDIERAIFWGEGIALLLLFSSFEISYEHILQKRVVLAVYVWIFLFSLYGTLTTYFLWGDQLNSYYLIRHLSFFYYALFFFAGYRWGPEMIQRLSRYWLFLLLFVILLTFFIGGGIGTPMVLGFVWLVCQKGNPSKVIFYSIPLGMIYLYLGADTGTSKVMSLLLFCSPFLVYFMRLWTYTALGQLNKFFFRLFLLLGSTFLMIGANKLINLVYDMAAAGETFHVFANEMRFTDMNGIWRILLWSYLFDRFVHFPFGVGLGTPLVGNELASFMYLIQKPEDLYTSGAHNSFITFLVRLGIPFLIYFIFLFSFSGKLMLNFLHKVNFRVLDRAESRFVFASILTFLIGIVQSSFNVVLESPIAAGIFWFNFGLFVRIVGDFLAQKDPLPNSLLA